MHAVDFSARATILFFLFPLKPSDRETFPIILLLLPSSENRESNLEKLNFVPSHPPHTTSLEENELLTAKINFKQFLRLTFSSPYNMFRLSDSGGVGFLAESTERKKLSAL